MHKYGQIWQRFVSPFLGIHTCSRTKVKALLQYVYILYGAVVLVVVLIIIRCSACVCFFYYSFVCIIINTNYYYFFFSFFFFISSPLLASSSLVRPKYTPVHMLNRQRRWVAKFSKHVAFTKERKIFVTYVTKPCRKH